MADDIRRPRFYEGKILRADDLEMLQSTLADRQARHHRLLHGWGVVDGLIPSLRDPSGRELVISTGVALDGRGRELLLSEQRILSVTAFLESGADPGSGSLETWYPIFLHARDELLADTRVAAASGFATSERVVERIEIVFGRPHETDGPLDGIEPDLGTPAHAAPDVTPWRVLIGYVEFIEGRFNAASASPPERRAARRTVGAIAGELVSHGDRLIVRLGGPDGTGDGLPIMVMDETEDGGRTRIGLQRDGIIETLMRIDPDGGMFIEGVLRARIETQLLTTDELNAAPPGRLHLRTGPFNQSDHAAMTLWDHEESPGLYSAGFGVQRPGEGREFEASPPLQTEGEGALARLPIRLYLRIDADDEARKTRVVVPNDLQLRVEGEENVERRLDLFAAPIDDDGNAADLKLSVHPGGEALLEGDSPLTVLGVHGYFVASAEDAGNGAGGADEVPKKHLDSTRLWSDGRYIEVHQSEGLVISSPPARDQDEGEGNGDGEGGAEARLTFGRGTRGGALAADGILGSGIIQAGQKLALKADLVQINKLVQIRTVQNEPMRPENVALRVDGTTQLVARERELALEVTGPANFAGSVTIKERAVFSDTVTINGALTTASAKVTGNAEVQGTLTLSQEADQALLVEGSATFNASAEFADAVTILGALRAASAEVTGNATVLGELILSRAAGRALLVEGSATFKAPATFEQAITIDGLLTAASAKVTGNEEVEGTLTLSREGGEALSVAGHANFKDTVAITTRLKIGDPAAANPEQCLLVNGDAEITGRLSAGTIDIEGELSLDGALSLGRLTIDGQVGSITLARDEQRNPASLQLMADVIDASHQLSGAHLNARTRLDAGTHDNHPLLSVGLAPDNRAHVVIDEGSLRATGLTIRPQGGAAAPGVFEIDNGGHFGRVGNTLPPHNIRWSTCAIIYDRVVPHGGPIDIEPIDGTAITWIVQPMPPVDEPGGGIFAGDGDVDANRAFVPNRARVVPAGDGYRLDCKGAVLGGNPAIVFNVPGRARVIGLLLLSQSSVTDQ